MKKLISVLLILVILSLTSCREEQNAYEILTEFASLYGAEGIIYSPEIPEGQGGYLPDGLVERIFLFTDGIGENFAILLNTHIDSPAECGVFVCSDDAEMLQCEEVCLERLRVLGSEGGFVKRRGRVVYYALMPDPERAERIFKQII